MYVDSKSLLCGRCLDVNLEESELIAYLDKYVSQLPAYERADERVYASRLRACAACPEMTRATCRLCGCYVQARAAKKRMRCPMPGAPAWIESDY